jgi:GTP cyclohydrolase III
LDTKQKSKKLKKNSVNERQRRHVNVNKLKKTPYSNLFENTEFHVKMAHINVIMATGIILPFHHANTFCHHVNAMMTSWQRHHICIKLSCITTTLSWQLEYDNYIMPLRQWYCGLMMRSEYHSIVMLPSWL